MKKSIVMALLCVHMGGLYAASANLGEGEMKALGEGEMKALVQGAENQQQPSEKPLLFDGGGSDDKIWVKALQGYQRFKKRYPITSPLMKKLATTQKPQIMVVACSDSRVSPELVLGLEPGDLFMVRNVANIVPFNESGKAGYHGVSAALEYGINFLKVKHLIVLGHSSCGGIKGVLTGVPNNEFITPWISQVKGADVVTNPEPTDQQVNDYAKIALNKSYENSMKFPWIKDKVDKGELIVHVWFFDIQQGKIFTRSKDGQTYQPLNEEELNIFLTSKRRSISNNQKPKTVAKFLKSQA
ncbi:MAG: hypothetical protein NT124_01540 [Candidatus Dependentiae bacterium]|nr:hypothetical protein [Candidatus Dependentiae bacterium]